MKEISLYNPIGQKVKAVNIDKEGGNIILEKGNLAKGIYMLVIRTENYTSKSKLIIE